MRAWKLISIGLALTLATARAHNLRRDTYADLRFRAQVRAYLRLDSANRDYYELRYDDLSGESAVLIVLEEIRLVWIESGDKRQPEGVGPLLRKMVKIPLRLVGVEAETFRVLLRPFFDGSGTFARSRVAIELYDHLCLWEGADFGTIVEDIKTKRFLIARWDLVGRLAPVGINQTEFIDQLHRAAKTQDISVFLLDELGLLSNGEAARALKASLHILRPESIVRISRPSQIIRRGALRFLGRWQQRLRSGDALALRLTEDLVVQSGNKITLEFKRQLLARNLPTDISPERLARRDPLGLIPSMIRNQKVISIKCGSWLEQP